MHPSRNTVPPTREEERRTITVHPFASSSYSSVASVILSSMNTAGLAVPLTVDEESEGVMENRRRAEGQAREDTVRASDAAGVNERVKRRCMTTEAKEARGDGSKDNERARETKPSARRTQSRLTGCCKRVLRVKVLQERLQVCYMPATRSARSFEADEGAKRTTSFCNRA